MTAIAIVFAKFTCANLRGNGSALKISKNEIRYCESVLRYVLLSKVNIMMLFYLFIFIYFVLCCPLRFAVHFSE